jgi:carbonic anhydrase/acetyltransferase-like protein (isoleucine patch superfamily)
MPVHTLEGITPELPQSGRYWIAPNATLIGKVTVGEGVGIWFGVVIRGDQERITIGADTNIQELTVIHTDTGFPCTIGTGVTVGHRVIIHGCTVGNNVLIGMGAIIINGAKIGDDSLVGAGALVTEGRDFPPGSLILGAPAKVVRPLTEHEIARNRASAAHYVRNWKRYSGDQWK